MEDLDTLTKFLTSPCGKTWPIIPTWMKPIVLIQPPKESQAFTLKEDGEPKKSAPSAPLVLQGGTEKYLLLSPPSYPTSSSLNHQQALTAPREKLKQWPAHHAPVRMLSVKLLDVG